MHWRNCWGVLWLRNCILNIKITRKSYYLFRIYKLSKILMSQYLIANEENNNCYNSQSMEWLNSIKRKLWYQIAITNNYIGIRRIKRWTYKENKSLKFDVQFTFKSKTDLHISGMQITFIGAKKHKHLALRFIFNAIVVAIMSCVVNLIVFPSYIELGMLIIQGCFGSNSSKQHPKKWNSHYLYNCLHFRLDICAGS